ILRIEDTDRERSTQEMVEGILVGMRWLGLDWDEGPFFQSQRLEKYQEAARRLAAGEPAAIRFAVPPSGSTAFDDAVFGRVEFANTELEDFVLLRSDGVPTYHLSVVTDDLDMRMTHIIRGADHLSNTPKQVLLYQ